jgi:F-type H+-transporting ATPase subunit a
LGAHSEAAAAHPPEIPNLITLLTHFGKGPFFDFLQTWENAIFAFLIVLLVGGFFAFGCRGLSLLPGRAQIAVEAVVEGLDNLGCGVLGKKEGRRYLPFLGTLFLFILSMNLAGLVPGLKSPTSRFEMTGALALCVFLTVQWTGIRRLGPLGYLDHMIGQPRDAIGWLLSPLMLFIHAIGELVKPLSLALRLFGNIMGEDTLLGVFVALGALTMAWSHLPIGVPLHLPFVLLAIIFSIVQALVFTMLSMIYIYMMLPHEEAHKEEL